MLGQLYWPRAVGFLGACSCPIYTSPLRNRPLFFACPLAKKDRRPLRKGMRYLYTLALSLYACAAPLTGTVFNRSEKTGAVTHLCMPTAMVVVTQDIPSAYIEAILAGFDYWDIAPMPGPGLGAGAQPFKTYHEGTMRDPGNIPMPAGLIIVGAASPKEIDHDGDMTTFMKTIVDVNAAGCMVSSRVVINTHMLPGYPLEAIQTAARHEAGHLLGLADNYETPGVLMYFAVTDRVKHPIDASPLELFFVRALRGAPLTSTELDKP
jgi:hypothetical protein